MTAARKARRSRSPNRCTDPRVVALMHDQNQGVGGAFLTGMRYAIERGADVIVKIDADGQMDPAQVPALIHPILSGQADYVKGDRFFFLTNAAACRGRGCSAISRCRSWQNCRPATGR